MNTERSYTFGGEAEIPDSKIRDWAVKDYGMTDIDEIALLKRVIRRTDGWYLERRHKEQEAKSKGKRRGK